MPISIVVQSAEALTILLTVALCVRIFTLYRASEPRHRPPMSNPAALPKPDPMPSQAPTAILESYIDEVLGKVPMSEPYLETSPSPASDGIQQNQQPPLSDQTTQPPDSKNYQSIAHFLLSRRFDTESV